MQNNVSEKCQPSSQERDEARSALASARATGPTAPAAGGKRGAAAMDEDADGGKKAKGGVSQEVVTAMVAKSKVGGPLQVCGSSVCVEPQKLSAIPHRDN
jgi:hypothetical protein